MKRLIIVFSALLLWNCTKVLDYEIPYSEPRITLDARIITDDSVYVFAAISSYIMNDENPTTDSLFEIFLYEDDVMIEKLKPEFAGYHYDDFNWNSRIPYYFYSANYKPKAGHKYKVEAARQNYTTVYGEQLLQNKIVVNNWSIDTATSELRISFTDQAETEDYYRIQIISRDPLNNINSPIYFATTDPTLAFLYEYDDGFEDPDFKKSGELAFFTDEYFNGKTKQLVLEILHYQSLPKVMEVEISRISKDLYLFESTKSAQWKSDGFVSEPIQIYTNVENGFGIVGSLSNTYTLVQ